MKLLKRTERLIPVSGTGLSQAFSRLNSSSILFVSVMSVCKKGHDGHYRTHDDGVISYDWGMKRWIDTFLVELLKINGSEERVLLNLLGIVWS